MNTNEVIFNKHYYNINELLAMGFSYYKIKNLVCAGKLNKINKSLYENNEYHGDDDDFETACAYIHQGVVCMLSAAKFYGLTNYIPDSVDVAIERKMKVSSYPLNPPVNIWYFSKERYESEIISNENESIFRIYSLEKTIVDIIYYRNKVGIEETKEVLNNYLKRSDRNLIKLHKLAEKLGCVKILKTYLEVLL